MSHKMLFIEYLGTAGHSAFNEATQREWTKGEGGLVDYEIGVHLVEQGLFAPRGHIEVDESVALIADGKTKIPLTIFAVATNGRPKVWVTPKKDDKPDLSDVEVVLQTSGGTLTKATPTPGHSGIFKATLTAPKISGEVTITGNAKSRRDFAPLVLKFAASSEPAQKSV